MKFWPLIKLVPIKTNFRFVRYARWLAPVSIVLILASLFFTIWPLTPPCGGLNCGIDFKGGTLMELSTAPEPVDLAAAREALSSLNLQDVQVQSYGQADDPDGLYSAMVRFQTPDDMTPEQSLTRAQDVLRQALGDDVQFSPGNVVGPKVSGELFVGGVLALAVAVILMMFYIWFRFEWQFGLGALIGLFHDAILVFGLFALTQMEFTLTSVASILTVIGYSMNDTVVVFDRLRENLRKYKRMPLEEVIDLSLNETLSRTIMTGITTLMALLAMAILGGEALFGFSVALIVGIVVGTYSSIYVAAPVVLLWGVKRGTVDDDTPEPVKLGMASRP